MVLLFIGRVETFLKNIKNQGAYMYYKWFVLNKKARNLPFGIYARLRQLSVLTARYV